MPKTMNHAGDEPRLHSGAGTPRPEKHHFPDIGEMRGGRRSEAPMTGQEIAALRRFSGRSEKPIAFGQDPRLLVSAGLNVHQRDPVIRDGVERSAAETDFDVDEFAIVFIQ